MSTEVDGHVALNAACAHSERLAMRVKFVHSSFAFDAECLDAHSVWLGSSWNSLQDTHTLARSLRILNKHLLKFLGASEEWARSG
jgi:hypothetical protein